MPITDAAPGKALWPKDHFRRPLLETPFHERLAAQVRTGNWHGWGGYLVPRIVESREADYTALRNVCALFDITPLVKYRINGPEAEAFLNRLTLRDVTALEAGRVQYTAWCDDDGKVLDDGTLFRLSETEFRLCCRERHLPWLLDSAAGFDVAIEEVTQRLGALALQGPTSASLLRRAGFDAIDTLEHHAARSFPLASTGVDVLVARAGFTGDLGYEIFVPADQGPALWDVLWKAGRLHGLRAAGTEAADMARIEAGFILGRRDYIPSGQALRVDRRRSPYEIGLGWMVDLDKGTFAGRRALAAESAGKTSRWMLVGLDIDGPDPATGSAVRNRHRRVVGTVTSAIWSPTARRSIALASVERKTAAARTGDLWVEVDATRELQHHRRLVRARIVDRPFLRFPRRTAMPPGSF